jgi:hypothetical protein
MAGDSRSGTVSDVHDRAQEIANDVVVPRLLVAAFTKLGLVGKSAARVSGQFQGVGRAFGGVTRGISRGVAVVGHATRVVLGYGTVVAAAVGVRAVQGWRDHLAVGA